MNNGVVFISWAIMAFAFTMGTLFCIFNIALFSTMIKKQIKHPNASFEQLQQTVDAAYSMLPLMATLSVINIVILLVMIYV